MDENDDFKGFGTEQEGIKRSDFYEKLRRKITEFSQSKRGREHKFIEYILLVPDLFYLLCKLTVDKDVPVVEKTKLVGVITYFISPIDLVPEVILGPIGYLDDIALVTYVLNGLLNKVDSEVVKRNWPGDEDILDVIQQILRVADKMIGVGLWNKIKMMFGAK